MNKDRELKRVSLFIGEDQYRAINDKGLNLSWLVRDLIDDFVKENKIVLNVSDETLALYQKIVSTTNPLNQDFEPFFREALHNFLKNRIEHMLKLEKNSFKKSDGEKK